MAQGLAAAGAKLAIAGRDAKKNAAAARELGATRVGVAAPYLGYMRQDKRFQDGEAVTSAVFAKLLSWLDNRYAH